MSHTSPSEKSTMSATQVMDGAALHRANRLQEAVAAYQVELQKDPNNAYVLNNYGGLLCSLGEFRAAQDLLKRAVKIKPDMADAWSNFGNVLFEQQDYRGAIESYKTCLKLQPQQLWL
nr:tetratricopeptide repeat protein [Acetobacter syzygii]